MRIDRQDTLENKLDEILKSSQAAQKAAESANSYLFWMNVGWYARIIMQIVIVVGLVVFGAYLLREVRTLRARLPQDLSNINLPINISVNLPAP